MDIWMIASFIFASKIYLFVILLISFNNNLKLIRRIRPLTELLKSWNKFVKGSFYCFTFLSRFVFMMHYLILTQKIVFKELNFFKTFISLFNVTTNNKRIQDLNLYVTSWCIPIQERYKTHHFSCKVGL